MKFVQKLVLACAIGIASSAVWAADKVVVLDMEQALLATDVMQTRVKKLSSESEFKALKTKFSALQNDLKSLVSEAKSNEMTWSASEKQAQRIKAEAKQAELRLTLQSLKQQEQVAVQEVMAKLGPKAKTALKQLTASEGIDVVLSRKAAVWVSEGNDITAKLTKRLNKAK